MVHWSVGLSPTPVRSWKRSTNVPVPVGAICGLSTGGSVGAMPPPDACVSTLLRLSMTALPDPKIAGVLPVPQLTGVLKPTLTEIPEYQVGYGLGIRMVPMSTSVVAVSKKMLTMSAPPPPAKTRGVPPKSFAAPVMMMLSLTVPTAAGFTDGAMALNWLRRYLNAVLDEPSGGPKVPEIESGRPSTDDMAGLFKTLDTAR